MTKKERAQVVELLRCAADELVCGRYADDAFALAREDELLEQRAVSAWVHALNDDACTHPCDGSEHLLEAAQRIEEGSWP